MAQALLFTFGLFLVACPAVAQVSAGEVKPYGCESNIAALDDVHHAAGEKGLIIVIARLGRGEKKRTLNLRRLHNVRAYLSESGLGWKRDPKTLVLAEGERVKGFGRVEVYVEGRLASLLAVKPNKDLEVGSCEPDDIRPKWADAIFYPYRDAGVLKPRKKVGR